MTELEVKPGIDAATGLDRLRAFLAEGRNAPMTRLLQQRLVEGGDGFAVVEAQPSPAFDNSFGRVHGGYAATLIDTAMGFAVLSKHAAGANVGTVDLKVSYVRKISAGGGLLFCRAHVLHAGRTMLTAEAKVADQAGLLYAHGSGTFLVYPK